MRLAGEAEKRIRKSGLKHTTSPENSKRCADMRRVYWLGTCTVSGAEMSRSAIHGRAAEAGTALITGAAADDPSAIGTYATAGARFGTSFLWTAPVALPMMFAVVYLSAKLGQVAGE